MQLHLLDATFELFRAYYGTPSRTAPDGREVGAVYGLILSTLPLFEEGGVTHLGAATDQVIESFRNRLYPGYKTGEGVPADLLSQFPIAEAALRAIGVVVWPMVEFEADDALASAAAKFMDQVERVVILSPDKDLAQCVIKERVVTFDRLRGVWRDLDGVIAKFGVSPESIPDYLALVGDSSDGFPGIPGWGAKSAAAVLAQYLHLEAIPEDVSDWVVPVRGAARLAATLQAERPQSLLFRELATLRRDAPIPETLADLEWQGVPRQAYEKLCQELGFGRLLDRHQRWREA